MEKLNEDVIAKIDEILNIKLGIIIEERKSLEAQTLLIPESTPHPPTIKLTANEKKKIKQKHDSVHNLMHGVVRSFIGQSGLAKHLSKGISNVIVSKLFK